MKTSRSIAVASALLLGTWGAVSLLGQSVDVSTAKAGSASKPSLAASPSHELVPTAAAQEQSLASPQAVASAYPGLAQRAENGDKSAAKTLYKATVGCDDAPMTEAALQKRLSIVENNVVSNAPDVARSILVQQARDGFSRCKWFSEKQADDAWHWLDLAVTAEDSELLSDYYLRRPDFPKSLEGQLARKEYIDKLVRLLSESAERGESASLRWLSDIYDRGLLTEQDPVLAYAYMKAYVDRSQGNAEIAAARNEQLARMGSKLSSNDMKQAEQLIAQLNADH